jgi:hypothetical protein
MFIVEKDTFNLNMYDGISDFGILVLENWILQYLMVAL